MNSVAITHFNPAIPAIVSSSPNLTVWHFYKRNEGISDGSGDRTDWDNGAGERITSLVTIGSRIDQGSGGNSTQEIQLSLTGFAYSEKDLG
ncbi:hypothetical protein HLRTI_003113 [Halorhabdus tiamatea SARL4B]|uniref:Uncharacterized protein n=1 Tax=Halorhabdus tiamatea SARL4B TaxID=1033806 RepID=U2DXL1_9EURY|nr:hypothetical protein HLRTI_003113 [Halorhabdus tiamatea SARL4B]